VRREWTIGVATAAMLAITQHAAAQVDNQCMQRWQAAVTARAIAERCKNLDAAGLARLKEAEEANLACLGAGASETEKRAMQGTVSTMRDRTLAEAASKPCSEALRPSVALPPKGQYK